MPKQKFKQAPPFKCLPSVDFNNLLSGLFRLAVAHFEPSSTVSNVSAGVSDLIKSIKLKEVESPGSKAYRLLLFALGETSAQVLLDDYSRNYDFKATFSDKNIKQVTDQAQNEEDFTFDDTFLSTPSEHPLVARFLEDFQILLEQSGANERLLYGLEEKFKSYYIDAFHSEFSENYGQYAGLDSLLQNTTTPAYQREHEWKEYRAQLIKQVYQPIFNEHFGLRQIYVPLNAYYHIDEGEGEQKQKINVICRIEEELDKWIIQKEKQDGLRIITGDPGAGKSTIAKVWASKLAEHGKRVIYISLNQVRKSTRPQEVIEEFIKSKSHRFKHNPYDLLGKEETTPILFIFDGLDEWIAEGSKSIESVKVFIHETLRLLREANASKVILRVLLLSRPIAIQENLKWFVQDCRIYHVLPLYVMLPFDEGKTRNYELLKEDKRLIWKALYTKFNSLNFKETLLKKEEGELAEVSAQPLLIYLLTIALNAAKGEIDEEKINVNSIYALILDHVYERKYDGKQKHRQTEDLTKDQYFEIMENIACSAWRRGDERTTTQNAINEQFKEQPKKLQKLWDKYANEAQDSRGVEALLSSFYFQKKESTSDDALYEFSHKSFGEYLMARYIVRTLRKLSKLYRGKSDEAEDENIILQKWYEEFGYNRFKGYLLPYIERELQLQKDKRILKWQNDLTQWFNHLQINSFNYKSDGSNFEQIFTRRKYFEVTLLELASLCAKHTNIKITIESWIGRNSVTGGYGNNNSMMWLSKWQCKLNMSNMILTNTNFGLSNVAGMHFYNSDLSNSNFDLSIIAHANFSNAKLVNTNFSYCNGFGVNFNKAKLISARFFSSYIYEFNFIHANLSNANFSSMHIYNSIFYHAIMNGAKFTNVVFENVKGLTIEQLSQAQTLYGCTGLPKDIYEALQAEEYKHLWESPALRD